MRTTTSIRDMYGAEPTLTPGDAYVQSFARGLSVIRAFSSDRPSMTLSEVAAATGLTRAGARRILLTLAQLGYVAAEGRQFRLTARILDLGFAYLSSMPFWNLAEPIMEALVEQVHESSSASVLDGADIVYVLRVPTHKIMTISLGPGSRLPAWCTSMGRVLLSGLDDAEVDSILRRSKIEARTHRNGARRVAQAGRRGARPRLGPGQPGVGGGAGLDQRADPRAERPHPGRAQRQRPGQPDVAAADGEAVLAAPARRSGPAERADAAAVMRCVIVGGGIGGMALALSLHDAGLGEIEIHESAPALRELGVGINVLPHAVRELTELGLLDDLYGTGIPTGELAYYSRRGQRIWAEARGLAAGYRWPQFSIHRGELRGIRHRVFVERTS